jgi:hypothetical protein
MLKKPSHTGDSPRSRGVWVPDRRSLALTCPGRRAGEFFRIQISNSERIHVRIPAARCARAMRRFSPSKEEGAGKTGCALHPRSRVQLLFGKNAHEHTGSAEAIRPSLRNGFTAYFAISPVSRALLPPSLRRLLRKAWRQRRAPERRDFAVRSSRARQSQLSRPPHPTARS